MRKLLLTIVILAISGCDTVRGVTRVTHFKQYPSYDCIITTARSLDGISEISYSKEEGGRPLTLHGIEKPDIIHRYWYKYRGIKNDFYFVESFNGKVEFRHGYSCLNCYPPQEVIDAIYPFILELESQLIKQCKISESVSGVQEFCSGVKCPSA